MRRPLLVASASVLATALLLGPANAAPRISPKREIRAADQARARTMLLRKADLGPGFGAGPGSTDHSAPPCGAIDLRGVTVTGEATTPAWLGKKSLVFGVGTVYASEGDATRYLRAYSSPGALACLVRVMRRSYAGRACRSR